MKRTIVLIGLAFALLLGACNVLSSPTASAPTPTSTLVHAPAPSPPAGWSAHDGPSFKISLPDSWAPISLDEPTLKKEIDAASSDNPHLAVTLKAILDSGQFKSFVYYAVDKTATNIVSNVSVVRTPSPAGSSVEQIERDYAQSLPQVLKGAKLVAMESALEINGLKTGEIDYDLPLVNSAGQVVTLRGVQFILFPDSGDAYVVTVTGDAAAQDTLVPLARQIGHSFFLTTP